MRHASQSDIRLKLIFTLWGLLFIKCFTLEYLVRHYAAPINSVTYVWALSIIMAVVATAVYANQQSEQRKALLRSDGFSLSVIVGIVVILLVAPSIWLSQPQGDWGGWGNWSGWALPLAAGTLGGGHLYYLIKHPHAAHRWIASGWLVAAGVIAVSTSPLNFLVFAISILVLAVIPKLAWFFSLRRQ